VREGQFECNSCRVETTFKLEQGSYKRVSFGCWAGVGPLPPPPLCSACVWTAARVAMSCGYPTLDDAEFNTGKVSIQPLFEGPICFAVL
jgi:hypothetical protein